MPSSATAPTELLTSLLREVSRSFYLTLRILPGAVRAPIGLAYLLARTTDTVADTDVIPVVGRLRALGHLRQRILGESASGRLDFGELAGSQALAAERVLLERVEESLEILDRFDHEDRRRIRDVLRTIISGQELDLRRFDGAGESRVVALASVAELDDYTYRVAGCVGEFWTRMCTAHLFPAPRDPDDPSAPANWFETCGVRFGKGLQLVNVLRDLPRDLRQGRCYLPADALAAVGLQPTDLLVRGHEDRLRPVYDHWLNQANEHLRAGWRYTCALPARAFRLRLACAWPVLIGARTIAALRTGRVLDPACRIKVSRAEVRTILRRTLFALPFQHRWKGLYAQMESRKG